MLLDFLIKLHHITIIFKIIALHYNNNYIGFDNEMYYLAIKSVGKISDYMLYLISCINNNQIISFGVEW